MYACVAVVVVLLICYEARIERFCVDVEVEVAERVRDDERVSLLLLL